MVATIIECLHPAVHTFSRPFSRFGLLEIGARSTVLVLGDGRLAVLSPISLEEDAGPLEYVRTVLGGRVALLICPDLAHWLAVAAWSRAFPSASVVGVEGHDGKTRRRRRQEVRWDTLFTADTVVGEVLERYGVAADLDFCYFAGFVGRDLVTLHRPSGTIIEADLLFNLPATQQYAGRPPTGGLTRFVNVLSKDSQWSRRFLKYVGCKDRALMRQSAAKVAAWQFDNLIPCHGDVIQGGAKAVWRWVFADFLVSEAR